MVSLVSSDNPGKPDNYDGLTVLQHRGQDAAGIITIDNNTFSLRKDNGLVKDVFHTRHMKRLLGNMGIGHVRYPTAGSSLCWGATLLCKLSIWIALAHNGNLTNADELKAELYNTAKRHVNTTSDSEVLLNILAHELAKPNTLELHLMMYLRQWQLHSKVVGGYASVAMVIGHGMIAFRDGNGIRPLVFGKRETDAGVEYMFASESVALMLVVLNLFAT